MDLGNNEHTNSIKGKCKEPWKYRHRNMHGSGGATYCLGFIGAAVYFISNATSFWIGVLGFLKAIVWPGILVFELMSYLNL